MKKLSLRGLIPAPFLPFNADLKINTVEFGAYMMLMGQVKGLAGVAVNGHAGEVTALKPKERQQVIEVARENLPSSVPVFAGIQALSLEEAIERSREAENAGADGTLVLPPFDHFAYRTLANRPNVPYEFFNALSDSVDLPIIIFYYPKSTGMNYPIEELEKIATVDNVVAIKALEGSSADYYPIYKALKGKISVLASNDTPDLMGIMMLGSDGALIGVSSIGTQFWAEFVTACLEKRYTEARDLFVQRLSPLTEEIFTPPPGRRDGAHEAAGKEALVQLGIFSSSKVRPPKLNVSQNDKEVIRRVLSQTGLLESMVPAR